MKKVFITSEEVRKNAFRLAARIYQSGFYPTVIIIGLRGGASIGLPISEFFKWLRPVHPELVRVLFTAVTARSYTDIGKQEKVRVEGFTYDPHHLRAGDKVLLLDDIYDSGNTINELVRILMDKGIPREDVKVAVHDYKRRTFKPTLPVVPDFFCHEYVIESAEDNDPWLNYSHELEGLTDEELRTDLFPGDSELVETLLKARLHTLPSHRA